MGRGRENLCETAGVVSGGTFYAGSSPIRVGLIELSECARVARVRASISSTTKGFSVGIRGHAFPDGVEPDRFVRIDFAPRQVQRADRSAKRSHSTLLASSRLFWRNYPGAHADREIIRLNELPPRFVDLLIAVEDRGFYDHAGVSVTGILRAASEQCDWLGDLRRAEVL